MGSTAFGFDTGAWAQPRTPPSWLPAVRSGPAAVRPGVALPLLAFGGAAAVFLLVVGYGTVHWSASWGVLAGLLGAGALALAFLGYPLPAGLAVLGAIACWGFVARSLVPASLGDLGGIAALAGGTLAFAVPLLAGVLAGGWADGRRVARGRVIEAFGAQRWFGDPQGEGGPRGEPEPQLPALEQLPAARFFALPTGRCSHLVVAGDRAALIGATIWPRGEYTEGGNHIQRNGRGFAPGTDDVDGVVDDLRTWAARLAPAGATCQAFLSVHPASGRLTDAVRLDIPLVEGVRVVGAGEFVEVAGEFLAAGGNTLWVPVLEELRPLLGSGADPTG